MNNFYNYIFEEISQKLPTKNEIFTMDNIKSIIGNDMNNVNKMVCKMKNNIKCYYLEKNDNEYMEGINVMNEIVCKYITKEKIYLKDKDLLINFFEYTEYEIFENYIKNMNFNEKEKGMFEYLFLIDIFNVIIQIKDATLLDKKIKMLDNLLKNNYLKNEIFVEDGYDEEDKDKEDEETTLKYFSKIFTIFDLFIYSTYFLNNLEVGYYFLKYIVESDNNEVYYENVSTFRLSQVMYNVKYNRSECSRMLGKIIFNMEVYENLNYQYSFFYFLNQFYLSVLNKNRLKKEKKTKYIDIMNTIYKKDILKDTPFIKIKDIHLLNDYMLFINEIYRTENTYLYDLLVHYLENENLNICDKILFVVIFLRQAYATSKKNDLIRFDPETDKYYTLDDNKNKVIIETGTYIEQIKNIFNKKIFKNSKIKKYIYDEMENYINVEYDKLKTFDEEIKFKECGICIESLQYCSEISSCYVCKNGFHKSCFSLYLKNVSKSEIKCPFCRTDVTTSYILNRDEKYQLFKSILNKE